MGAIAGVLYPEYFPISYAVKRSLDILEGRSSGEAETYVFKNLEIGSRGSPIGHDDHKTLDKRPRFQLFDRNMPFSTQFFPS